MQNHNEHTHTPPTSTNGDSVLVDFEPIGRRGPCPRGATLMECAHLLGVGLAAVCGGNGTCGRCKVIPAAGTVSEPTSAEMSLLSPSESAQGVRLACQCKVLADCLVSVPPDSLSTPQRAQVEGLEVSAGGDPPVATRQVTVWPPSMHDVEGDADRVLKALGGATPLTLDVEAARLLPAILRECEWTVQAAVRGSEVVHMSRPFVSTLGLAVDLGTTKIAAYLVDLTTGKVLAADGRMNPQIRYGEDVVSRMTHVLTSTGGARELSESVVVALNELAQDLTAEVHKSPQSIVEAVIVGNTAMHHLLLSLPIDSLSRSPYVPALSQAMDVKARELGLNFAPGGYVHVFPNIAGFVGGDHVAALLAINSTATAERTLIIDIGTNTEVCLVSDGRRTSASCASGPAFEGGHIRDGMRAAAGAIEHVEIVGDDVHLQTIDDGEPVGLCGSGILDTLAELYRNDIVDKMGRLSKTHPRVATTDRGREYVLVPSEKRGGKPSVGMTQGDVRQLQLAKSAIETGIQVLLDNAGISPDDLGSVIVAGAFGTYIDLSSAMSIGMLPNLPLERFKQVGNAAGAGAKLALSSVSRRAEAVALARNTAYLELAADPGFMTRFVDNTYIAPFGAAGGD